MGARVLHTPAYRRLCELLRGWRLKAELTQRDLAARLKKPPSYVHKTEVGERRIDPVELVRWCRACELKPTTAISQIEGIV
jgi:predicted transcriptional regulator